MAVTWFLPQIAAGRPHIFRISAAGGPAERLTRDRGVRMLERPTVQMVNMW